MTRILRLLCALLLVGDTARASPPVQDAELAAAIALARAGDFQGALPKLDEVVRRLETAEAPARDLAQGYLHLGIAYLELGQQRPALERLRAAVLRDPELRLDPAEFSPQVIRFFQAAQEEVAAMRAPANPPAAPPPSPAPAPGGKRRARTVLIVAGAAAAAALAVAVLAGGSDAPTTTVPAAAVPSPGASTWASDLDAPGARGQIVLDGTVSAPAHGGRAGERVPGPGRHRLIGTLVGPAVQPGTWRFTLAGIRAGSLRPEDGAVASLSARSITFRLAGRAGERVAFTFESAP